MRYFWFIIKFILSQYHNFYLIKPIFQPINIYYIDNVHIWRYNQFLFFSHIKNYDFILYYFVYICIISYLFFKFYYSPSQIFTRNVHSKFHPLSLKIFPQYLYPSKFTPPKKKKFLIFYPFFVSLILHQIFTSKTQTLMNGLRD